MKSIGKIAVCVVGTLGLTPGVYADDGTAAGNPLPNNPYAEIVVRNVFNLTAPSPDAPQTEIDPLRKITPNGTQNFLGKVQVLFKVAGVGRPGQPPKDQFYMLSEGERADDIEVVHIDAKKGLVTFKNHGQVQELALTSAPAAPNPVGASPLPGGGNPTGFNPPNTDNGGGNGRSFGRFGGRGRGNNNNPADTSPLRTIPTRGGNSDQPTQQLSPEEQIIQIEQNRASLMDNPNPVHPPEMLPPTPLTGKY